MTAKRVTSIAELQEVDPATLRVLAPDRLSSPVTVEHEYLAAILLELQAANELLAALLAQGEPPVGSTGSPTGDGVVALREPDTKRRIKRS